MSALGELAGAAGGNLAWRVATAVLAGLLLIVGAGAGTGWWLAASARDQALADLRAEQGVSAGLRAGIAVQNAAVDGMAKATAEAKERGQAAQAQAQAAGRRYDAALQQLAGARATSCADAMPAVNQLLEQVR
jgi:hypothetical protein